MCITLNQVARGKRENGKILECLMQTGPQNIAAPVAPIHATAADNVDALNLLISAHNVSQFDTQFKYGVNTTLHYAPGITKSTGEVESKW